MIEDNVNIHITNVTASCPKPSETLHDRTNALGRGVSSGRSLGLPGLVLGTGGVVWAVSTPGTSQILDPRLRYEHMNDEHEAREDTIRIRTAFHGGVRFCTMLSSVGGSLRMWWIQECHSGGTWVALLSCYPPNGVLMKTVTCLRCVMHT